MTGAITFMVPKRRPGSPVFSAVRQYVDFINLLSFSVSFVSVHSPPPMTPLQQLEGYNFERRRTYFKKSPPWFEKPPLPMAGVAFGAFMVIFRSLR
jgi:hypothetical protein